MNAHTKNRAARPLLAALIPLVFAPAACDFFAPNITVIPKGTLAGDMQTDLTAVVPAPVAGETPVTVLQGTHTGYTGSIAWTITGTEEDAEPMQTDLTAVVPAPVVGETPVTVLQGTHTGYTGSIAWTITGTEEDAEPVTTFESGVQYTATLTLTAADGCSFRDMGVSAFTHTGAETVELRGGNDSGSAAIVTINFPAAADTPAPSTSVWKIALTQPFESGVKYTATLRLTAEEGCSFSSLGSGGFTHSGAEAVNMSDNTGSAITVIIDFPATAGTPASPSPFTSDQLDLAQAIETPEYGAAIPRGRLTNWDALGEGYFGVIYWIFILGDEIIPESTVASLTDAATFLAEYKPRASLRIYAKAGYDFKGLVAAYDTDSSKARTSGRRFYHDGASYLLQGLNTGGMVYDGVIYDNVWVVDLIFPLIK
jgi:hypothetical protein